MATDPAPSTSAHVVRGALWVYGAQIATVLVQFGYAAFTSRLVAPAAFGAYSVTLAVTALIVLVANGGLSQTVARMQAIDESVIRSLTTYSLLLGGAAAAVLFVTADFWAVVWRVPAAADPIRWMAINAFTAPLVGIATGYARRTGRFRALSIGVFSSNVIGMAVGAVVVVMRQDAVSLLVSSIVSQTLLLVVCVRLSGGLLAKPGGFRAARGELGFSAKVVSSTVLAYFGGNVGKWGVSWGLGPASLGQLNRAEIVSYVPFQYVQDAMTQAIYPEFRHHRGEVERASRVWGDLLALTAWVSLPVAAAGAALLPVVVPLLLGPGWAQASLLAIPLALIGGAQIAVSVLYNALEAVGRFRSIWLAQSGQIVLNAAGAAGTVLLHSFVPIIAASFLGLLLQHAVQLAHAGRLGYVRPGAVVLAYLRAAAGALLVGGAVAGVELLLVLHPLGWPSYLLAALVVAAAVLVLLRTWHRLPPVALARRFGLLPAALERRVPAAA